MRDIRSSESGQKDRSIRKIPVSPHRRSAQPPPPPSRPVPPRPPVDDEYDALPPRVVRRRPRRRLWWLALAIVVVAALLGFLLSTVFAGATIVLHPKTATVTPPTTLEAQVNAPLGVLPYEIVTIVRSATTTVPATGSTQVKRQATGSITISNSYSTQNQRLISNTRLAAPDGKIYRLRDSVTVPGETKKAGAAAKPGTVDAIVYADSPGPDYNKPAGTTFTIPGFKGDSRYTAFSAKATSAIVGGFVGTQPSVSASDLAAAKTALAQQLGTAVSSAAQDALPEGYASIPGSLSIQYSDLTQTPAGSGQANVSQSATAVGAQVRIADLATAIARKTVDEYQGEAVLFSSLDNITVSMATTSKAADGSLTLKLAGSPQLVWQFDPNAVKQALLGKPKSTFEGSVASFAPAVACTKDNPCDAKIRPFWSSTFPSDPAKITIQVATP